ncbi:MAG: hypothetical protein DWQ01_06945 [Planctomycetota bacterium]|nr:MAG: hypothetical protein DWQ01_06945 [Planctomycetota bacterium]
MDGDGPVGQYGSVGKLKEQLVALRPALEAFLRAQAGVLILRYETPEDLAQEVIARALQTASSDKFVAPKDARAWVYRIARNHIQDRRRHWQALKRGSGAVLRFHWSQDESQEPRLDPSSTRTGPATQAQRREHLILATRALSMLLEQDRKLVAWSASGVSPQEQADRLGVGYYAAAQARTRAIQRFRRTFDLLLRNAANL